MSEATETTETTETTTQTNGKPDKPDKGPSILEVLHKQWEAAGKKDPSAKQTAEMIATYKAASKKQQAAQKALDEATAATDKAAADIVAKHGRHIELPLDDGLNVPACYGQKVYFKRVSSNTRKTLGTS